jgi:hypothetical protein
MCYTYIYYFYIDVQKKEQDWKLYSLECTDIPKVFFTPHDVGHYCTDVIWGHSCTVIPCLADWVPHRNNDSQSCRLSNPMGTDPWSCRLSIPIRTPDPQPYRISTPARNSTDKSEWACKMFFAHATAWTPNNQQTLYFSI